MGYHESNILEKWDIDKAEPIIDKLINEIIAFEIVITKIEGKNKFSQDKSSEERASVLNHVLKYYPKMGNDIKRIMKTGK